MNLNDRNNQGFALLEALITIVILAFGLLAIAGLQLKVQAAELESYQRSQALVLLNDMVARINTNRAVVADYVAQGALVGVGEVQVCPVEVGVARDICEWGNALKGAAETAEDGTNLGAMIGARGCIEQISAAPATVRVAVAWQGTHKTSAPLLSCGEGEYGDETYRRVISEVVVIGALI